MSALETQFLAATLARRASTEPNAVGYRIRASPNDPGVEISYGLLHARAGGLARKLAAQTVAGDAVLLACPAGAAFLTGFFSCLYAGVLPVPIAFPEGALRSRAVERFVTIAADSAAKLVLTTASFLPAVDPVARSIAEQASLRWIAVEDIVPDADFALRDRGAADGAFVQYTSGSTSKPKGVVVSYRNLAANLRSICDAMRLDRESRGVIWLPPFHDMGLVGGILAPLYAGFPVTLMPPSAFLQNPLRWLRLISEERATISGGPNFGYDLCLDRSTPEQRLALDLSSWKVAFVGGETVRARTLDRFARGFSAAGFDRNAFMPCYGLAEATLMVSCTPYGKGGSPRWFDRAALDSGLAIPVAAADGAAALDLIPNGAAVAPTRIHIVDPASGRPLQNGSLGEVWVAGPSVSDGYWNSSTDTASGRAALPDDPRQNRQVATGDIGFQFDGELYLVGRQKDVIIIRGRNHYAEDIEETVIKAASATGVGAVVAARTSEPDQAERLVIIIEVAPSVRAEARQHLIRETIAVVTRHHGIAPARVVLVRRGSLPRTTSGKVQRSYCLEWLRDGRLVVEAEISLVAADDVTATDAVPAGEPIAVIKHLVSMLTGLSAAEIDSALPLAAFGIDSLGAMTLLARLEQHYGEMPSGAQLAASESIAALASRFMRRSAPAAALQPVSALPHTELSPFQWATWYADQSAGGRGAHELWRAFLLPPETNVAALLAACRHVVNRHDVLRLTVATRDGAPHCVVAPPDTLVIKEIDCSGRLEDQFSALASQSIDLAREGPLRVHLVRCADGSQVLVVGIHHIAIDFLSAIRLFEELGNAYGAALAGTTPAAAAARQSFGNYVEWMKAWLSTSEAAVAREYWEQRLANASPFQELPFDRRRGVEPYHRVAYIDATVTSTALRGLAAALRVTPCAVVLAALKMVLANLSGNTDVVVGCPFHGRVMAGQRDLVGPVVNVLPLRTTLFPALPFADTARSVQTTLSEAASHQLLPFVDLLRELRPPREPGVHPLFQTLFAWYAPDGEGRDIAGVALGGGTVASGPLSLTVLPYRQPTSAFELTFSAAHVGDRLSLSLAYSQQLFDRQTAQVIFDNVVTLIRNAMAWPDAHCEQLLASTATVAGLPTPAPAPAPAPTLTPTPTCRGLAVHRQFLKQAERNPDATAVLWRGKRTSYRELAAAACKIATRLAAAGVRPEDRVIVDLPRSPALVAALLGTMLAGGAYVPIDRSQPVGRRRRILELTAARVALTDAPGADRFDDLPLLLVGPELADTPEHPAAPDATESRGRLAYVLFTSGSTGEPKGVAITHDSVATFLSWAGSEFAAPAAGRILASTPITFDLSVFEIFLPLTAGGTVVLAENFFAWAESADGPAVDLINTVPSILSEALRVKSRARLSPIICLAGEPLSGGLAAALFADQQVRRIANLYGPTETTTYSTISWLDPAQPRSPRIGRSILGTAVYVLNDRLQQLPPLAAGEVYIAGGGLARGYIARPGFTADRFVPDPFGAPGTRMYRTGDIGRWRADGELEHVGRRDQQVKIRGMRIELGDVEAGLLAHASVQAACAMPVRTGDGSVQIGAAYTVRAGADVAVEELARFLAGLLPPYMVPRSLVRIEQLPLGPHGKLDRAALLRRLEDARENCASDPVAPKSEIERVLHDLWAELLLRPTISTRAAFFDLGGDSLTATRLLARAEQRFGVRLDLQIFVAHPTIEAMAEMIALAQAVARRSSPADTAYVEGFV